MNIHVHSIVWNEEVLLPYFLRHYTQFADVFIANDHSTDNTVKIAESHPRTTVIDFPHKRGLNEKDFSKYFEDAYKEHSREADWVICVDADEFVYHPQIAKHLSQLEGVIRPAGYNMLDNRLPRKNGQIYDELFMGVRSRSYDKPVVFQPHLDIKFEDGRHRIQTDVKVQRKGLLMLHYRYLSREYFQDRTTAVFSRMDVSGRYERWRMRRGLAWYDRNYPLRERVV